jgi:ABC-type amino acid transport substrate-binding protein
MSSGPSLRSWAAALALCTAALPVLAQHQPRPLRLTTHELHPYTYALEGRPEGIAVRAVLCAMGKLGQPVEIVFLPWSRAMSTARQGEADGYFGASQSADRDAWGTLSGRIADQKWVWYLPRDSRWDPFSPEFRQQARVTGMKGSNMMGWLRQQGFRVEAELPRADQLLQMLMKERVDAVLANHLVMDTLLREQGLGDKVRSVLQQDKPLGVYFTHRFLASQPAFLPRFNQALPGCVVG